MKDKMFDELVVIKRDFGYSPRFLDTLSSDLIETHILNRAKHDMSQEVQGYIMQYRRDLFVRYSMVHTPPSPHDMYPQGKIKVYAVIALANINDVRVGEYWHSDDWEKYSDHLREYYEQMRASFTSASVWEKTKDDTTLIALARDKGHYKRKLPLSIMVTKIRDRNTFKSLIG